MLKAQLAGDVEVVGGSGSGKEGVMMQFPWRQLICWLLTILLSFRLHHGKETY